MLRRLLSSGLGAALSTRRTGQAACQRAWSCRRSCVAGPGSGRSCSLTHPCQGVQARRRPQQVQVTELEAVGVNRPPARSRVRFEKVNAPLEPPMMRLRTGRTDRAQVKPSWPEFTAP